MTCISKSLCSDLALNWLSEFTGNSFSCASNLSKVGRFVAFDEGCSFFSSIMHFWLFGNHIQ